MILVIQVIVWWAGLMRGAVSIALAYNKVNLLFGPFDLSFGLEMLSFCVLHPFQNIGNFCYTRSNFSNFYKVYKNSLFKCI